VRYVSNLLQTHPFQGLVFLLSVFELAVVCPASLLALPANATLSPFHCDED